MVAQNSPRSFLAKVDKYFGDNILPERHRSGVVQATFRLRSDVVQNIVQADSTQCNPSCSNLVIGQLGRSKKVARPGSSCEFFKFRYKNISVPKNR